MPSCPPQRLCHQLERFSAILAIKPVFFVLFNLVSCLRLCRYVSSLPRQHPYPLTFCVLIRTNQIFHWGLGDSYAFHGHHAQPEGLFERAQETERCPGGFHLLLRDDAWPGLCFGRRRRPQPSSASRPRARGLHQRGTGV